jgi:hypothetical protein
MNSLKRTAHNVGMQSMAMHDTGVKDVCVQYGYAQHEQVLCGMHGVTCLAWAFIKQDFFVKK